MPANTDDQTKHFGSRRRIGEWLGSTKGSPQSVNRRWPSRLIVSAMVVGLCLVLGTLHSRHSEQVAAADAPKAAAVRSAAQTKAAKQKPASSLASQLHRIPPVEPSSALKTFRVARGFHLELVTSEPHVSDPVDACFDADGRMYVAEMHGYPFSQEPTKLNPHGGGAKNAGIVRLLEDTNGDGRMDRSVKFATGLMWPTSVCCYDGGVFVLAPPNLHYFKDTDGDGKADISRIVYTGFNRNNVQAIANNMKWLPDNRIGLAGASNPSVIRHNGKEVIRLGSKDMSFDPKTETVWPITGGVQFGHSLDDWGDRFVSSNSNHIQSVMYPYRYLRRNPYYAVSGPIRSIAKDGPAAPVFRISQAEPWRIVRTRRRTSDPAFRKRLSYTERFAVGFFTAATGVTIYRGSAYPPQYRGNAFIGDAGSNLVHRKIVQPNGASFVASRADKGKEFIASTDNWFRPVNFVNAPDGTLYILDMYRETIEHPHSIPVDIKEHLHLEGGNDRGRIYRIAAPGTKRIRPPKLASLSSEKLVPHLASPNSWNRETAQRLLWERQDRSVIPAVQALFRTTPSPLGRLHAIYTLGGLNGLSPELLIRGIRDPHPRIREHAIRLSEKLATKSPKLSQALLSAVTDKSIRVRFQLAFSLGEVHNRYGVSGLSQLARHLDGNRDVRAALMTSVNGQADQLASRLLDDPKFLKTRGASALMTDLARITGAQTSGRGAVRLLTAATSPGRPAATASLMLRGLGEGLRRRSSSVARLLSALPPESKLRKQIAKLFQRASRVAANSNNSLGNRQSAIGLLAFADFSTASRELPKYLSPQTPQSLQLAAVRALSQQSNVHAGKLLIAGWQGFSPKVRREVIDAMTRSASRIGTLLSAVDAKTVQRSEISRETKQLLLNHPNRTVRGRSRKLFGGEISANRVKVVAAYRSALELATDVTRGKQIFTKRCSICHRVGETGHRVGPDLASVSNKSPADLLLAMLDPNREAQPKFVVYNVVTEGGKLLNGIIAAETATSLTLLRAEGKQDIVLRSNIDELISTGKSLMPEGLEKDLSPQQLADVIAFIKTIKPKKR